MNQSSGGVSLHNREWFICCESIEREHSSEAAVWRNRNRNNIEYIRTEWDVLLDTVSFRRFCYFWPSSWASVWFWHQQAVASSEQLSLSETYDCLSILQLLIKRCSVYRSSPDRIGDRLKLDTQSTDFELRASGFPIEFHFISDFVIFKFIYIAAIFPQRGFNRQ